VISRASVVDSLRSDSLIAQSEHLAETHLVNLDPTLDLVEREVGCINILDLDFDIIAAAAGFTKQTIATISRDPGAFSLSFLPM